jgi:hypothetical protein
MQSLPDRRPRAGPARWRVGRSVGAAVWLTGSIVVASLALLTPFTASRLFPTRTHAPASAVTAAEPTADAGANRTEPPRAAEPAGERQRQTAPMTPPITPPVAAAGTLATGLTKVAVPAVAALPLAADVEFARTKLAPSPATSPGPSPPAAARKPVAEALPPAPVGTIPSPRASLPLQTELIVPDSAPAPAPALPGAGAGAAARPEPAPAGGGNDRSDGSAAPQRRR